MVSGGRGNRFYTRSKGVIPASEVSQVLTSVIERKILVSARIGLSPLAGVCGPLEISCPTRRRVRISVGCWDVSAQIAANIEESLTRIIEHEPLVEANLFLPRFRPVRKSLWEK